MGDEMTTENKLMLIRCQLLLQKAQVENNILTAKSKLRHKKEKSRKIVISTSE
ncbi:hypothetical protein DPMN_189474 [Dreissena polymorpha]|uniref:Uncharacterized protein n=1 Tax=Dreissena polymorpha TaxID=45954 RepID=A0A9D4ICD4_DREPO|nr:hypothetical protein DPMN_189474 [Dreissena polymorpha]